MHASAPPQHKPGQEECDDCAMNTPLQIKRRIIGISSHRCTVYAPLCVQEDAALCAL